ncbi:MAG: penicillin-binding transpeptidase domain-containing protein [Eubacteriales bacterium]|nr:penicillin-binding transpeptidase domain-containing protein [Eubacteriales bacterium]
MKILTKRAFALLILSVLLIIGLLVFTIKYINNASDWAQHPTNKHLFRNGQLQTTGKIYDRKGEILLQTVDGAQKYNNDATVRKAVMHAIGDSYGNVMTSAQVAFGEKLSGWDMVNGAYRFNAQRYKPGNDITLTLDSEVCVEAYKAMNRRKGTVGVYNYKTGEIICMVSTPTFDPENRPDVEGNPDRYEGVYINRLLSAAYTPGSVFKLITAEAAIDTIKDIDTRTYECAAEKLIDGNRITCPAAHGNMTFKQALAHSCNVTFAEITLEIGGATLQKYADKAGFNSSHKVNGISTSAGKVDVSNAKGGDLAWAGIGQYSNTANPLSFMTYVGAIGNDGIKVTPSIIKDSNVILSLLPDIVPEGDRIITQETAASLGAMMRNNTIEVYGEKNFKGLELCAKSGTAEVGGEKAPHAWFTGYMDRDDCPLAFVVVVENGGSGSRVAGSIAGKVLQKAVDRMSLD